MSNNTTKKVYQDEDRQSLVYLPFTTSSQEMEWVYSYNPGACMGKSKEDKEVLDVAPYFTAGAATKCYCCFYYYYYYYYSTSGRKVSLP